jgi:hypothetical protein
MIVCTVVRVAVVPVGIFNWAVSIVVGVWVVVAVAVGIVVRAWVAVAVAAGIFVRAWVAVAVAAGIVVRVWVAVAVAAGILMVAGEAPSQFQPSRSDSLFRAFLSTAR